MRGGNVDFWHEKIMPEKSEKRSKHQWEDKVMTRINTPILLFAIPATLLLTSLACSLSSKTTGVVPTIPSESIPTYSVPSLASGKAPAESAVPTPITQPDAAACDRMSFIDVAVGSAQTTPFSDICAMDCKQTITFTNHSPSEVIKLIFFEEQSCRPDQGCLNVQRWYSDYVLTPGDSIERVQFNRTPHSGECPWSATTISLVGAIPTGSACSWVIEDPGASHLPLQEIENQCR
jgi:hypothetical protein